MKTMALPDITIFIRNPKFILWQTPEMADAMALCLAEVVRQMGVTNSHPYSITISKGHKKHHKPRATGRKGRRG